MSMTWREVVDRAMADTRMAYAGDSPDRKEWLATFEEFYDELMAEHRITSYPVDPPASKRMARSRATVIWADDYSNRV